jgi:hypothetical protein
MPFKFNAISGKLDYYETSLSMAEITDSILTDLDTAPTIPEVEILFNDSGEILYVDDNEEA